MPRRCLICYKLIFDELSNSPEAQAKNTFVEYLKLIDNGTFKIPFQKFINAGMDSCKDCCQPLEDIYQLYHDKTQIEYRFNRKISELGQSIILSQANSTGLETLRAAANTPELTVEAIINFRGEIVRNTGKLKAPPLPLPTSPLETSALDPARTSETVTCQSSSSSPPDTISSDNQPSHQAADNTVGTAKTPDRNWFKVKLADKLRPELKNGNELMNDNITQLTNPIAEAGNIVMQGSSIGEGEIASSLMSGNFTYEENMNLDEVAPTLGEPSETRMPSDHYHPFVCGPGPPTTSEPIAMQSICYNCGVACPTCTEQQLHLLSSQNSDTNGASNYAENPIYTVPAATPALSNPYLNIPPTPVSDLETQLQNEPEKADEDSNLGTGELPPFSSFSKPFRGSN